LISNDLRGQIDICASATADQAHIEVPLLSKKNG